VECILAVIRHGPNTDALVTGTVLGLNSLYHCLCTGCFKNNVTTLKAGINLFSLHVQ
jgi:hypothetical protein